ERPLAAPQPRRGHADAEVAPVRAGNAQAHGRTAKARRLQDRRGLGPSDPFLRAGPEPHQGPAHQRRDIQYPEGAGRRPRSLHPGQPQARRLTMSDTIIVLTGASRGLGAALARGLAEPSTLLVTLARRPDPSLQAHARERGCDLE